MRFHHTRFDVDELKATLDDVFSKRDEVHGQMTEEEPLKYDNWKKGLKSAESRKNAEENGKLSTEMIALKSDNTFHIHRHNPFLESSIN